MRSHKTFVLEFAPPIATEWNVAMISLQEYIPLSPHTTFKVGGAARFFGRITTCNELVECVAFARQKNIPIHILGEGSNTLVSDDGFDGLVIQIGLRGIEWNEIDDGLVEVIMSAGEHWDDVVEESVRKKLSGFETLSGIPGSVGAAPVQNIGAYGSELKDTLRWVEVLDVRTGTIEKLSPSFSACGYRDSIFKKPEGASYVVLRVACILSRQQIVSYGYKDVVEYMSREKIHTPTVRDIRNAVLAIRALKLPNLSVYGTAGSFFKNPVISTEHAQTLQLRFPDIPLYDAGAGKKKVSAAWILDRICGYKGHMRERVGVYPHQSLVLINHNNATTADVILLAADMSACVLAHTHISLEWEVVTLGNVS